MKKKSYAARLGALAVALTMMTASLMGGTLAKYTTEVTGTGEAIVAKWAVKAGDKENASSFANFTLSDTVNVVGVNKGKIAPGTSGKIPVYVDLSGTEVATQVSVEIMVADPSKLPSNFVIEDMNGTPIKFDDKTYKQVYTIDKTLTDLQAADGGKIHCDITWKWLFEDTSSDENAKKYDSADEQDGINAATANFTVKVTATQIAPTATQ